MARRTLDDFAAQLTSALGDRLTTLLLYGSAARESGAGSQELGAGGMNTLLIVDSVDAELFTRLSGPVRDWLRAKHPPPLVLTDSEWRESANAFPIEYEDIRAHHRVLAGRDPWAGITVRSEHVRRQLEHELIGKLMHLRQAFAAYWNDRRRLSVVVREQRSSFLTMLRALLRLAGRAAPAAPDALVRDAAALVGFAPGDLAEPAAYLDAVTRTAEYVNRMERKSS